MKPLPPIRHEPHTIKQRGVVLFFALIALVVMSLAAVALIRSVDTSTLIAGNLAFKQSASSSGDAGLESAIKDMYAIQQAMDAAGMHVFLDAIDAFNTDHGLNIGDVSNPSLFPATMCTASGCGQNCCKNPGYYSSASAATNFTDGSFDWDDNSTLVTSEDSSGNQVRYVVERMCNTANQILSTTNCLFGGTSSNTSGQQVPLASSVCTGSGCPSAGAAVIYRITVRITGPRNTVSYVQSFVY